MLKKAHYTTFKKEIIIELQKTVEGIFNLELEQFKAKSEKTLLDSHALYHGGMTEKEIHLFFLSVSVYLR